MRRSVVLGLLGLQVGILSGWFLGLGYETGADALQYHRMASAIVRDGLAPWVVNPLSYFGIYPGSDSSGVPFLAASLSMVSGATMTPTVLLYDGTLIAAFGLSLFVLVHQLTGRSDLAFVAVLMGSLSFGFITTLLWSLDERSFNVAFAPAFLLLILPKGVRHGADRSYPRLAILALTSFAMLASHLNFLLLLPFLVVVPLFHAVLARQQTARRKRRTSLLFFGAIAGSPLLIMAALDALGLLTQFHLEYQLESSALFAGNSPPIFLANALVFIGTRIGPVNLVLAGFGLAYLATRSYLPSRNLVVGAFVLTGLLGLPIIVYSKDLLTPIFVILGIIGVGALAHQNDRRRLISVGIVTVVVLSGSVGFDSWNLSRTSLAASARYWSPLAVTPEDQSSTLWMSNAGGNQGCAFGNNAVLLQQVTTEPPIEFCTGVAVDFLINSHSTSASGAPPFAVVFGGTLAGNPGNWLFSPELTKVANDFSRLPALNYQAGRQLLMHYNVTWVVVDLEKPYEIPLFDYQGNANSLFFTDLWANAWPLYRTTTVAIFQV